MGAALTWLSLHVSQPWLAVGHIVNVEAACSAILAHPSATSAAHAGSIDLQRIDTNMRILAPVFGSHIGMPYHLQAGLNDSNGISKAGTDLYHRCHYTSHEHYWPEDTGSMGKVQGW